MKRHIIGLDIGGTKCAAVLAEAAEGFPILDRVAFPTETGFDRTKEKLFAAVHGLLSSHGVENLEGIGVSCGGPLDSARGVILSPPNLPGWDDVHIVELLEREFRVPAYLQNDANACALVEWQLGAGRGTSDMVFLTMGTGMGAGIIAGGLLLTGPTDTAGEVGHVRLAEDGPEGYGKNGSFEGFCSGGGIARAATSRARKLLAESRPLPFGIPAADIDGLDARRVAEAAAAGDKEAVKLLEETGRMLGRGIAMLIDVLNPEAIVLGSVFIRAERFLRPSMEAEIRREALPAAARACRILPASTGESIGDLAAVMTAAYGSRLKRSSNDRAPFQSGMPHETGFVRLRNAAERGEEHMRAMLSRHPELSVVTESIRAAADAVVTCFEAGGKVLVCGNGGSAADSDHIVGELLKGFMRRRPISARLAEKLRETGAAFGEDFADRLQTGLPAVSLAGHPAFSTAFANDVASDTVFAQQVLGLGRRGDVLVCLSTSGDSRNVLLASIAARAAGITVVALTGPTGGKLKAIADILVAVPGNSTAEIQEHHLPSYHAFCAMIEDAFFNE